MRKLVKVNAEDLNLDEDVSVDGVYIYRRIEILLKSWPACEAVNPGGKASTSSRENDISKFLWW